MSFRDYTKDEALIAEAMIAARQVQDFIWGRESLEIENPVDDPIWIEIFQKRVDKIKQINFKHPNAIIELRKRVLQQACLSIMMLKRMQNL